MKRFRVFRGFMLTSGRSHLKPSQAIWTYLEFAFFAGGRFTLHASRFTLHAWTPYGRLQ
jgi:hypothetical protein